MTHRDTAEQLLDLETLAGEAAAELFWSRYIDPDDYDLSAIEALDALRPAAQESKHAVGLTSLPPNTLIAGDLRVTGDLEVNDHLAVLGDLECSGYIYTNVHCCLVVAGSIRAAAAQSLRSYWLVGGSIQVPLLWAGTYGTLLHRGPLEARLLVEEMEHERGEECGPLQVQHHVVSSYVAEDLDAQRQLEALLRPEARIDGENPIDVWQLLRTASTGAPLFR